jgi:hypothetical protein
MSGDELFKLSLMMDAIVDAGMDAGMSPIEMCQVVNLELEKGLGGGEEGELGRVGAAKA